MTINLFGANATQTAESFTLHKADLGLSPGANAGSAVLAAAVFAVIPHYAIALIDDRNEPLVDDAGEPLELDDEELPIYLRTRATWIWQRGRMEEQHTIEIMDQQQYAEN